MLHPVLRLLHDRYTNLSDTGGLRHIGGGHVLAFRSGADKPRSERLGRDGASGVLG